MTSSSEYKLQLREKFGGMSTPELIEYARDNGVTLYSKSRSYIIDRLVLMLDARNTRNSLVQEAMQYQAEQKFKLMDIAIQVTVPIDCTSQQVLDKIRYANTGLKMEYMMCEEHKRVGGNKSE